MVMGIDIVQWWLVDWYCDGCSEVGLVEAVKSDQWSDVARWSEGINLVKPISQWIWHLWPSGGRLYLGKQKLFDCKQVLFCFVTLATCSRQSVIEWPVWPTGYDLCLKFYFVCHPGHWGTEFGVQLIFKFICSNRNLQRSLWPLRHSIPSSSST